MNGDEQDVGVSGSFLSNMISVDDETELLVSFSNKSSDTPIPAFGAYVQIDFPTTGEYSAPENPPTGADAQKFNWSQNVDNPNIWIGVVNTEIPVLSTQVFTFTVLGENITNNAATLLYVDLASGSDSDSDNNNAELLLSIQESLPVELVDFFSKNVDCKTVHLNWSTASEVNNYGFEILVSLDGDRFKKIGFVEGLGDGYMLSEYSFVHNISDYENNKNLYYRLKQIDLNSSFSLSKISTIKKICNNNENHLSIGPSPTTGNLNFQFSNEVESSVEVVIFNSSLQLVEKFITNTSDKNFSKDISDLPSGVYIIKTVTSNFQYSNKIVLMN